MYITFSTLASKVHYYTLVSLCQFLATRMQLILARSVSMTSYLQKIVFVCVEVIHTDNSFYACKTNVS